MSSALFRFLAGVAVIVAAGLTYHRASAHVGAGEPVQIAGLTFSPSPGQFALAIGVVVAIGCLLIALGMVSLFKRRP